MTHDEAIQQISAAIGSDSLTECPGDEALTMARDALIREQHYGKGNNAPTNDTADWDEIEQDIAAAVDKNKRLKAENKELYIKLSRATASYVWLVLSYMFFSAMVCLHCGEIDAWALIVFVALGLFTATPDIVNLISYIRKIKEKKGNNHD